MAKLTQHRHSGNREKALAALMVTKNIREAAELSGIGERTIYRFLRDDSFTREYRVARRSAIEHCLESIQAAASDAVETLVRNLRCGQPAVEIRSAGIILENAFRGLEILDFQDRLDRLEGSDDK